MKTISWLLGDKAQSDQYTHHAVLWGGIVLYFTSGVFNLVVESASPIYSYVLLGLAGVHTWIWYASRFLGQFDRMMVLFMLLIALGVAPANWFFNGGSQGPTLLLYLISVFYLNFLFSEGRKLKLFLHAILIFVPMVLILTEPYLQDWVFVYPNEAARQIDLLFSYGITAGVSVLIMKMYGKRYRLEKDKVEAYSEQLKLLAERDGLTQLYNRSAFAKLFHGVQSQHSALSLAMIDLDYFKRLNDDFGHQCGDDVLVSFSHRLQAYFEKSGQMLSRHGGEEFLILFKQPKLEAYEALSGLLEGLGLFDPEGRPVTFSAGLVSVDDNEALKQVLERVDRQLYRAKSEGRNRICMSV